MATVEGISKLTQRQKELLRLILDGHDAKSAARELSISVHTVNEHLSQARRHLSVSSSREAARLLHQSEAAPPNDLGPNDLGVVQKLAEPPQDQERGRLHRLVLPGVMIMILIAAIAVSLTFKGEDSQLRGAAPATGAPAPVSSAEANPSPYLSRTVQVAAFDQLRVSGPFKIGVLVDGRGGPVELQGPPALLADTVVSSEGGILTIRFREGATWSWNPGSGVNVVVSAATLSSASVEGAAQLEVAAVRGDRFFAQTEGSGSISVRQIQVRQIQLVTAGAGGITAEGRAQVGTYVVGASGSIDAKRLKVESASIAVSGSGSAYADASKSANIAINGSGSVEVVGGAACVRQPKISRQVTCR